MRLRSKTATMMVLLLGGCVASDYKPPVDLAESVAEGVHYERDLARCQSLAAQTDPRNQALAEAFAGAVLGAAIGAIDSPHSRSSGNRAVVQGALRGARPGLETALHVGGTNWQESSIINCMSTLGYEVAGGGLSMLKLMREIKVPFMVRRPTDKRNIHCKIGYESGYVESEEGCVLVHGVVLYQ